MQGDDSRTEIDSGDQQDGPTPKRQRYSPSPGPGSGETERATGQDLQHDTPTAMEAQQDAAPDASANAGSSNTASDLAGTDLLESGNDREERAQADVPAYSGAQEIQSNSNASSPTRTTPKSGKTHMYVPSRELQGLLDSTSLSSFSPRDSTMSDASFVEYDPAARRAAAANFAALRTDGMAVKKQGREGSEELSPPLSSSNAVKGKQEKAKPLKNKAATGKQASPAVAATAQPSPGLLQLSQSDSPVPAKKAKKAPTKPKPKAVALLAGDAPPERPLTPEEEARAAEAKAIAWAKKSAASKAVWERKKAAAAAALANPELAASMTLDQTVPTLTVEGVPSVANDALKSSKLSKSKSTTGKAGSSKSAKKGAPPAIATEGLPSGLANDVAATAFQNETKPAQSKAAVAAEKYAVAAQPEDEEPDDRLYCLCQQLYDAEKMMICCDRCDLWYHTECLGMTEDSTRLIDHFICPLCEKVTTDRSTYKFPCAREGCGQPALKLSKYCSDFCGLTVAAARLELQQGKLGRGRLKQALEGFRRPEAIVTVVEVHPSTRETAPNTAYNERRELDILTAALDKLVAKRTSIEQQHSRAEARLAYLSMAVSRWEGLVAAYLEANPVQTSKKSKSSKSGATASSGSSDAPCGFDVKLVWDDRDFDAWRASEEGQTAAADRDENDDLTVGERIEEEGLVCMISKRKCDRHTGWQKTREADYEMERLVLTRRLDELSDKERQLRRRIEDVSDLIRWHERRIGTGKAVGSNTSDIVLRDIEVSPTSIAAL